MKGREEAPREGVHYQGFAARGQESASRFLALHVRGSLVELFAWHGTETLAPRCVQGVRDVYGGRERRREERQEWAGRSGGEIGAQGKERREKGREKRKRENEK